jgi:hypothetical protein
LPTERLYIDKDKIIAKNNSGVETFNTNWNFIKSDSSGQLKANGYIQVPIFTLTEIVIIGGSGGNFTYTSAGIVETVDNTKGGQIAYYRNLSPTNNGYRTTGGTYWGSSFTFYLPKNNTGYCTFDLRNGTNAIIPKATETAPIWRKSNYYNPDQQSDSNRTVLGYSALLNITIGSVIVGKYRWYALDSSSVVGTPDGVTAETYPGPAILEPGMLDYWKQGGVMTWEGTTNRVCTNGYTVPPAWPPATGYLSSGSRGDSILAIVTGALAPQTLGLNYTL